MHVDSHQISQLEQLLSEPKFMEYKTAFYPGAPDEVIRKRCEHALNSYLERLISQLKANPTKASVIASFSMVLEQFENEDSEERDRLLWYLEEVMDIFKIESSGGILNEWRYGFDPTDT